MYTLYERDPPESKIVQTKWNCLIILSINFATTLHYDRISHTPTGLEPMIMTVSNPASERTYEMLH